MGTWHGVSRLLVAFSDSTETVSIERHDGTILLTIDGTTKRLSSAAAADLRERIEEALTSRESFFRTACEYREDGSYLVERRGAESSGNSTVFDSFEEVRRVFDRLPEEFAADDLTRAGITGSRRHMMVRHFVEHPAFPCELVSRNPLAATKMPTEG